MPDATLPFQAPSPLPACGVCGTPLRAEHLNTAVPVPCPRCGARGLAWVFPALFRPAPVTLAGEDLTGDLNGGEGEAACFFHPTKRAAVPCDRCGRFLCRLCDLDFGDGHHLCPECLRAGRRDGTMPELVNERPMRDRLALLLALLGALWAFAVSSVGLGWGIFFGLLSLMPAAAGLFLCARYWKDATGGPVPAPTARLRFVAALLLGLFAVLAWGGWAAYHMAYGFE